FASHRAGFRYPRTLGERGRSAVRLRRHTHSGAGEFGKNCRALTVWRKRVVSNGASYVGEDLAQWLDQQKMEHVRSAPYHPQTQGKIERWHQTLKNRILLEHYYLPGDVERQVAAFV